MYKRLARQPIRLHAFTSTIGLPDILPPAKLSETLPTWWKQLAAYAEGSETLTKPLELTRLETARHCYSMNEVFKKGIGIPLWADTRVVLQANGSIEAYSANRDLRPVGGAHHPQQYPGLLSPGIQHFKFMSPWSFVCEKPIAFVWTHPFYHQPDSFKFHTMPGIVEYKHQHSTNVNTVIPRTHGERRELLFSAGEMLAYIFPMSQESVELSVEEVSEQDFKRINASSSVTSKPLFLNKALHISPWLPAGRFRSRLKKWL